MATRVYKYGLVPIGYPPRDAERRVQKNTKAIRLNAQFLALRKKICFISFFIRLYLDLQRSCLSAFALSKRRLNRY